MVGTITSAGFGHRVGMNIAYAHVMPACGHAGTVLQLDMYGDLVAAQVIAPSPYDPSFDRIRC